MTENIRFTLMGKDHNRRQPDEERYSVICLEHTEWEIKNGTPTRIVCYAHTTGGHIGDFRTYAEAKEAGVIHPHAVEIKFWPDETTEPSEEFLSDLESQKRT